MTDKQQPEALHRLRAQARAESLSCVGTEMAEPTLQQWKRRALKAEAELASVRDIRSFEHEWEMQHHRERKAQRLPR